MKYKEILDKLEEIEGQLDDSFYSYPNGMVTLMVGVI